MATLDPCFDTAEIISTIFFLISEAYILFKAKFTIFWIVKIVVDIG